MKIAVIVLATVSVPTTVGIIVAQQKSRVLQTNPATSLQTQDAGAGRKPVARVQANDDTASKATTTSEAIRQEALRPNGDPEGLPLPLAANWNTGWDRGISPKIQMELIAEGHYLLPWINLPPLWEQLMHPNMFQTADGYRDKVVGYYQAPIQRMVELKLPFTINSTQWEYALTYRMGERGPDQAYPWPDLPADQNPNVVTVEGKILRGGAGRVSAFGPIDPWREVGNAWTTSAVIRKLQEWYPDPPLVMFLSNNEHGRLELDAVESDRRYLQLYGKGRDSQFKSQVLEQGYVERFRALQEGMRVGLTSAGWKKNAIFVGYGVGDRPFHHDSPRMWDGGSPSYYVHNWMPISDYQANSPAIGTMRWVSRLAEVYAINPRFWWEISTWDGWMPGDRTDKRKHYTGLGQTYSPARYGGFVQFGMWLHRPRVVREFRSSSRTWGQIQPYFEPIMAAVDRVHDNPTLRAFWRKGRLVANRTHSHPDQGGKPAKEQDAGGWFLLDTSVDPERPWNRTTTLPVFALALVQGTAPTRQWLVYAHAPLGDRKAVGVTIPEYKPVTVDVQVGGAFHLIDEAKETVVSIRSEETK